MTMPTALAQEIVIKQYRLTGRCAVRSGGNYLGKLNDRIQAATIPLTDKQEQVNATTEILADYGYEYSSYSRDEWGNALLTYTPARQVCKAA
jgi:hypothetical protein